MANVLPLAARVQIASALVDGCSIRATERLTSVTKKTITRLLLDLGDGCRRLHDRIVRDVEAPDVEADEIWSFVGKKEHRCTADDPAEYGDAYTFVAMARTSKLVISYLTGKRDLDSAHGFVRDLKGRLLTRPRVQVSTDGFQPYIAAFREAFGLSIDYGQVVKQYGAKQRDDHRYEPPRTTDFIQKTPILGAPSFDRMSTSMVERQNLTIRMHLRRLTRLTNAYSKRLANLRAAIALHFAWYNLCRVHETIRVTPAMQAGLTDHVWSVEELVVAALAEPVPTPAAPPPLLPPPGGYREPEQLTLPLVLAPVAGLLPPGPVAVANDVDAVYAGDAVDEEEAPATVRDPVPWGATGETPITVGVFCKGVDARVG